MAEAILQELNKTGQLSSVQAEITKPIIKCGRRSSEPDDKNGFGIVLWRILGGEQANGAEAAERLKIDRTLLSSIIHGRRRISRQKLTENQWREALAQYYPDAWQQHKPDFERCALALPETLSKTCEPDDKKSFGFALWHILGGEQANITEAAERLKINRGILSAIIHGRVQIFQQALIDKQWRETFAEHYPAAWRKHKSDFERCALALTESSIQPKRRSIEPCDPSDESGFGIVLWRILGGKRANMREAAKLLRIDPVYLGGIIQGTLQISQRALIEKQWRETLAERYPDAWRQHESDFEQRALALPAWLQWGVSKGPARSAPVLAA